MRLTLRTLLAYLDNTLEPDDEASLREKVQTSTIASSLVSRIRSVLTTRTVGAPNADATAPNDDANTVAEYLDSTLAPELTADVERRCLESEAHLAEVAATHQVLAAALAERTSASAALRKRIYELAPNSLAGNTEPTVESNVLDDPTTRSEVVPAGPEDSGVSDATTRLAADPDLSETLAAAAKTIRRNQRAETKLASAARDTGTGKSAGPAMAGSRSRAELESLEPLLSGGRPSRIMPWLVSLGLAAAFLLVLSQAFKPLLDSRARKSRLVEVAENQPRTEGASDPVSLIPESNAAKTKDDSSTPAIQPPDPVQALGQNTSPQKNNPPVQSSVTTANETVSSGANEASSAQTSTPETNRDAGIDEPTRPDTGKDGKATAPQDSAGVRETTPNSSRDVTAHGPPRLDDPATLLDSMSESTNDQTGALNEAKVIGGVQDHGGLLLSQMTSDSSGEVQWQTISKDQAITNGQVIVCPPNFRSRIVFDGGVELTLIGPAGLRVERRRQLSGNLGITIDYGRATLMATSGPATIWIASPVASGWIELGGSGAMTAIEISHRRLPSQTVEHSGWKSDLIVDAVSGKVGLRLDDVSIEDANVILLPTGRRFIQTFGSRPELRTVKTPAWVDRANSDDELVAAREKLAELVTKSTDPVEYTLLKAVEYPDLSVSRLASETLASLGVVYFFFGKEDAAGPTGLLNRPEQRANWPVLVESLRDLFERGEDSANSIGYAVTLREGEQDGFKFLMMLLGFTSSELTDQGGAALLVAMLEDPKMSVRVMAIETLKMITGETYGYQAEWESAIQRRTAVNRWKSRVKNNEVRWSE